MGGSQTEKTVLPRRWRVGFGGLAPVTTQKGLRKILLDHRRVGEVKREAFFVPMYDRDINDVAYFSGMDRAIELIFEAIDKQERILVYGDYDADGITSTAVLVTALRDLGARVTPFLPHRVDHGYGLDLGVLKELQEEVDLLITCDCGIANYDEIAWLKGHGIITIVTDHHTLPTKLPPADTIVHPLLMKQGMISAPLCGAGVSWKLATALLRDKRSSWAHNQDYEKWLLDLVAIGTIADVVPMTGENRVLVQFGLEILRRTHRLGLRCLLARLGIEMSSVTAKDVAFSIVPLLNAAGRMDHPQPALSLLLTDDEHEAQELVRYLVSVNEKRRVLTRQMVSQAEAQMKDSSYILVHSREWLPGMVGLVAGRLADNYNRPAIVVGSNGKHAVGSARSPEGTNILNFLQETQNVLMKLGGHAQAAGFSLDFTKMNDFEEGLDKASSNYLAATGESVWRNAEAVLSHGLIDWETVRLLESFAPFGPGNDQPEFVLLRMPLVTVRQVGKEGKHLKCSFEVGDELVDGIGFGLGSFMTDKFPRWVDVVAGIEKNEYKGQTRLQLSLKDIVPAGTCEVSEE